jgi:hypothetical protein
MADAGLGLISFDLEFRWGGEVHTTRTLILGRTRSLWLRCSIRISEVQLEERMRGTDWEGLESHQMAITFVVGGLRATSVSGGGGAEE